MAKIVAADHAESVALSTGNVIWGTAKYMAPERVTGTNTDPRTDLYAIGCIGFEILVGAPVFSGTTNEMLHAHIQQTPATPSSRRSEIPPELDAVILRCLAKKPDDRYATAADLYAALHKVPGYPAPKAETRRHYVPTERSPISLSTQRAPSDPGNLRGALRQVAEALLDIGLTDVRLVSGVAYLRDHERSLARLEAALDALEHEVAAVHETVGDREASLRFAIGELHFAATQSAADADQIRELEARLQTAVADGDRLRAIEQGIASITAVRGDGLHKLKAAYAALERVVDQLMPGLEGHPGLEVAAARLAALRARQQAP